MKVYLTGAFEYMDVQVGFGNAASHIYDCLKKSGVDVHLKELDSNKRYDADIEICFDQPHRYKFMSKGFKIGYTPWESTKFMNEWPHNLQKCDEVWTTSNWCQEVFQKNLPGQNVFTYAHGIDHRFRPKKRRYCPEKPFTFLFIGEPYHRKDGALVVKTFIDLFGKDPNYRLIVKATKLSTIQVSDPKGLVAGPPNAFYDNIIMLTDMLSPQEMIELYDLADVFVYPTWGEGFGFNPLQALAMGIPTIATYAWADYAKYITVPIDTMYVESPWPIVHPGMMMRPNASMFKAAMSNAQENYEELSSLAFKNSFKIHEEFDWLRVTQPAVKRLEKIFKTL